MKLLITGAGGFIGTPVIRLLLAQGHTVHAASLRPEAYPAGVQGHVVDLLAGEGPELIARVRPTHMLHLAWSVAPGKFWTGLENVRWLQISLDLIQAFAASGGRRWVGVGSCAEYDWSQGGTFREADPPRPSTLYGASKISLQMTSQMLGEQLGIETAWVRIFFPYGPGEPPARLLPSVIQALLAGRPAACTEGSQVRDFVFVEDVAFALSNLLVSTFCGPINVGSGVPVTVRQVVETAAGQLGKLELVQFGGLPARTGEPQEIIADIGLLRSLGLAPRHSLEEGIERTIHWWKNA
ncbi:MAG: NAD(P)-dependent oxidoreductase [Candidatus Solibacter sp.]